MNDDLDAHRINIDALDAQLLDILARRMAEVQAIGATKKAKGLVPLDATRWNEVLETRRKQAEALDLSTDFVARVYTLIHEHALELEAKGSINEA